MILRKVLVVPYVRLAKRKTRLLVVRDAEYDEWTFISGTCEFRESVEKCAIRELYEETKGLVQLRRLPYRTNVYRTHDPVLRARVDVMFVPLRLTEEALLRLPQEFRDGEGVDGMEHEMQENVELRFETLAQFRRRKRVWAFVKQVMDEDNFHTMCPV